MTPGPKSPPKLLGGLLASGADRLEVEIMAEKAAALGRSGRALERALAALEGAGRDDPARVALAYAAAEAAHACFIQRELMGFRSHDDFIRRLAIPDEVLRKVGAKP